MLIIGFPVFIISHKLIDKNNKNKKLGFTKAGKRFGYRLLSPDLTFVASQSVHRSVILFGLFHTAIAANRHVIYLPGIPFRSDRREKIKNEKDIYHRSLYNQPGPV